MERFGILKVEESDGESGWESASDASGDEFEFKPEVDVYERVGLPGTMISAISGTTMSGNLGELQKKINRMVQSPDDRFIIYVNAIFRKMISGDIINLSEPDLVNMLSKVKNIRNIEYKNPTAYILGYIASQGGNKKPLDKATVNKVLNILPKIDDISITPPDVIRYARYWQAL